MRTLLILTLSGLLSTAAGADDKLALLQEFSEASAALAAQVSPAVVAIKTEKLVEYDTMPNPFMGTPFEEFFGLRPAPRRGRQPHREIQQGLGSGVIVSAEGYILTNNHVVTGRDREKVADRISVELLDRRRFEAEVVGRDPLTDLAVLRIEAPELPTVPHGDSDRLRVGEIVVAVGNPLGQLHTVTMGIVSAVGRGYLGLAEYEDYIQTDAAINPGNSGGALINTRGELVGINTAIITRSGGYQGIGLAIPINMARNVMEQLVEHGKVRRGLLGVTIQPVTQEVARAMGLKKPRGVLIGDVVQGGGADRAGLERGDIILELNGMPTDDVAELRNRIAMMPPGSKVELKILRDGREKTIGATLGEREEEGQASASAPGEIGGQLGLKVQTLTDDLARQLDYEGEEGVVVTAVRPGSPAARAGLRRGDLILEIDRRPVATVEAYEKALEKAADKGAALLLVRREQYTRFVALEFGR